MLFSRYSYATFLSLCAVGAVVGCDSGKFQTAPVTGSVTLDGAPVTRGAVMFVPEAGRAARGVIQSDGTFTLTTYQDGDGALVGPHKVSVFFALDETMSADEMRKFRLPAKYAQPASSGLTCDVKSGEVNQVRLDLTSK
jgi:hypothetical protein